MQTAFPETSLCKNAVCKKRDCLCLCFLAAQEKSSLQGQKVKRSQVRMLCCRNKPPIQISLFRHQEPFALWMYCSVTHFRFSCCSKCIDTVIGFVLIAQPIMNYPHVMCAYISLVSHISSFALFSPGTSFT